MGMLRGEAESLYGGFTPLEVLGANAIDTSNGAREINLLQGRLLFFLGREEGKCQYYGEMDLTIYPI